MTSSTIAARERQDVLIYCHGRRIAFARMGDNIVTVHSLLARRWGEVEPQGENVTAPVPFWSKVRPYPTRAGSVVFPCRSHAEGHILDGAEVRRLAESAAGKHRPINVDIARVSRIDR